MRTISILGSTGSIGCNTLKVVEFLLEPKFRVVALAAGRNVEKLAEQIKQFKPELVAVENETAAEKLLETLHKLNAKAPRVEIGEKGLIEVATREEADTIV